MSRFAFKSPAPNFPEPGRRMQHNMCPTVILRDGRPYAGVGLPGGRMIVTVTSQLVMSLIDFKATPQQAVAAPRIYTEGKEPLLMSDDVSAAVVDELKLMGHRVDLKDAIGDEANVAVIDRSTGTVDAAASSGPAGVALF